MDALQFVTRAMERGVACGFADSDKASSKGSQQNGKQRRMLHSRNEIREIAKGNSEMNEEEIKEKVRERYGAVARSAGKTSCCSPVGTENVKAGKSCCGGPVAESAEAIAFLLKEGQTSDTMVESYTAEERAALPEGADLGLGCGVPTHYSKFKPGERVLDLGSGAGVDCFLVARDVGPTGFVIGVDMTKDMIVQSRKNKLKLGIDNVEFRLGEIESLPVYDTCIDVVISNCVLNLVPNKPKAFSEIARVLKPGGRMVVSDMMVRGVLPDVVRHDIEAWAGCIAGAPTVEEYLAFITNAGMKDVKILLEKPYDWGGGEGFQVVSCIVEAYK